MITAPAYACGGWYGGGCAPCGYVSPCGATYERLPDPEVQYHSAPIAQPRYYYVDQGPTYSGPGNFAPPRGLSRGRRLWGLSSPAPSLRLRLAQALPPLRNAVSLRLSPPSARAAQLLLIVDPVSFGADHDLNEIGARLRNPRAGAFHFQDFTSGRACLRRCKARAPPHSIRSGS